MNKDVIYIEPEDDITDIITKIEGSKQKIVALVPPKKAGILRSIVNIKLIAKAGTNAKKSVVLVTTDPSILKLAAATKLPVTKDLQSAPSVPNAKVDIEESATEKVEDEEDEEEPEEKEEEETEEKEEAEEEKEKEEEKEPEDKGKKNKKDKKKDKKLPNNPVLAWIVSHKKTTIAIIIGLILLILFLIWALVFAPAVTVTIVRRTTLNNFSESVSFTSKLEEENASEGKFYLEKRKNENTIKRDFEATGTKNVGQYASGEVMVYKTFWQAGTVAINAGSSFVSNGLSFVSTEGKNLSWNAQGFDDCINMIGIPERDRLKEFIGHGCRVFTRVAIRATAPGSKYNLPANDKWESNVPVDVLSDTNMAGGTDKTIKVITQADVEKTVATIKTGDISTSKFNLIESIKESAEEDNTIFIIENSFKQTVGEPVVTPKVGEEVKDGVTPSLTVTVTDAIFVIDETKVKEFITEKAKLANNYRIYKIGDEEKDNGGLFIENFLKTDDKYTGKLKTTYISGPSVTENDIIEIVRGKGIGTAQHDLMETDGVSGVRIDPSYPWVSSVPNDPEKITIIFEKSENE